MTPLVRYFLRRNDRTQQGPLTQNDILKIFRRKKHDGYTGDSLYRRSQDKEWKPLRSFAQYEFGEAWPVEFDRIRRVGINYVQWVTAGHDDECTACKNLNGKTFPVDSPPPMPPVDCRCELWCKCILIPVENPRG
jgi:hypothetical protein